MPEVRPSRRRPPAQLVALALLAAAALAGCSLLAPPPGPTPTIRPPRPSATEAAGPAVNTPPSTPASAPASATPAAPRERPARETPARPSETPRRTMTAPPSATPQPTPTPAATATPSPTRTPAGPPNVVLVVVDSLRADHLSAYGYARRTTPNLDRLVARAGARFADTASVSPWTCPSNAALMTGRSPSSLGASWDTLRQSVPGSAQTLAELLHGAGYYTAGFVNNNCVKGSYGFAQGFDRYVDDLAAREGSESWNKVRADEMNAVVLDWLADDWLASGAGRQPLFLFVYYMEPHVNYVPPAPYDTLYDPSYTGPLTGEAYGIGQAVVSGALVPSARDIDHLRALYDGEVTFWDVYLGELIEYLESNGLLENTLLVVTSDHGELFGEHGKWVHGSALYEEEVRVPLLLRYDGVIQPGQVVRAPVQSYDLMPTILAYAGLDAPAEIQAVSLQPLLDGTGGPGERVIYSELDAVRDPGHWAAWIAPSADLRSIREGGWKLIHHRGAESDDELFALPPGALHEGENLLGSQGDLAARLRRQLLDWFGLP